MSSRLATLLEGLIAEGGVKESSVPGVLLVRADEPVPRSPLLYQPCIIVIAQGRKRVWLGNASFDYDPNNYLVLAAPMPMECETMAIANEPLLGMTILVDPVQVGELLLEMDEHASATRKPPLVGSTTVTDDVMDAATRLAKALASPVEARVLGGQIVREIVFHVLRGPRGETLRLLAANSTQHGQIARVLRRIHDDYASDLDVASLAREAHMGVSTFHQAFRDTTSTTPLQYIKQTRLHRARTLLVAHGVSAQEAAHRVGYASASQFGREYKRMFGVSPGADRAALSA